MKIYNIIRLVGFIGVWLFLLQSCKDEEQLNSKFEIEGTALQQSLDGNASTVVVQVKTTLPMSDWQVESDADWLKVYKEADPEKGQVIVMKAESNNTRDNRTATISVTSAIHDYTITVLQLEAKSRNIKMVVELNVLLTESLLLKLMAIILYLENQQIFQCRSNIILNRIQRLIM